MDTPHSNVAGALPQPNYLIYLRAAEDDIVLAKNAALSSCPRIGEVVAFPPTDSGCPRGYVVTHVHHWIGGEIIIYVRPTRRASAVIQPRAMPLASPRPASRRRRK